MSYLPVQLCYPHATPPTRAHANDAGLDLYAANTVTIPAGAIKKVPLGIAAAIPTGYVGLLVPRSGLGSQGITLANSVGVIDAGYRGEIVAAMINHSRNSHTVTRGDRVAQLVITPIITPTVSITDSLPAPEDGRNTAGFGSTGK